MRRLLRLSVLSTALSMTLATAGLVLGGVVMLAAWPSARDAAAGEDLLRRYRLRKLSNADAMHGPPFQIDFAADDCDPELPGVPEILGDSFDPAGFDEISVAGRGRILVYASNAIAGDIPSPTKDLVVFTEGADTERLSEASGDDDQPCARIDPFGWRLAFRGSDGVAGDSDSNVFLRSVTRAGDDAGATTVNLTDGVGSSYDPSLAARTRSRGVGGGIEVRERDARIAFVSTGDRGRDGRPPETGDGLNPDGIPQLFLWREREQPRFVQLTSIEDELAEVNRPSITANGRVIAFECTADLTPAAVSPLDPARVGNPDGVRQIYMWRARRGFRQITWSDDDCFAPRITRDGRFVFFCSRGDLLVGGNPEGNYEVFSWRARARRTRRLAQLTQTTAGDSVLPRPMLNPRRFVFYSTAQPPVGGLKFGDDEEGRPQCGPSALLWTRGRVRHVYGLTDVENVSLGTAIATGPPAPGGTAAKIQFVTNDPQFDGANDAASLLKYHVVRATRFPRSGEPRPPPRPPREGPFCDERLLQAESARDGDRLGTALALDDGVLLAGAPDADGGAPGAGAVSVFRKLDCDWADEETLVADDGIEGDRFGASVAFQRGTAVVGAPGGPSSRGAAYVFERSGTQWSSATRLTPNPTPALGDDFGASVAIDGDTAIVAAPRANDSRGRVYVFKRSEGAWSQDDVIEIEGLAAGALAGWAIDFEGRTLVVSAPVDTNGSDETTGAVYVYTRRNPQDDFAEQKKVVVDDQEDDAQFGHALTLSGDLLVVGSGLGDLDGMVNETVVGKLHVFVRANGRWLTRAAPSAAADDGGSLGAGFGRALDLGGNRLLVGAPGLGDSGLALLFVRANNGSWGTGAVITAESPIAESDFGSAVAVDGVVLASGAPEQIEPDPPSDPDGSPRPGTVHTYDARELPGQPEPE